MKMRDHALGRNSLAPIVEVDSPGVARAFGKKFEAALEGMVSPDPCVQKDPLGIGSARPSDKGSGGDALTSVEPAVGSPDQIVEEVVRVLVPPAVQHGLRRAVGMIRPTLGGIEEKIGRRSDPDSPKPQFHPGDEVQVVEEDRPLREGPVALFVLKNEDSI